MWVSWLEFIFGLWDNRDASVYAKILQTENKRRGWWFYSRMCFFMPPTCLSSQGLHLSSHKLGLIRSPHFICSLNLQHRFEWAKWKKSFHTSFSVSFYPPKLNGSWRIRRICWCYCVGMFVLLSRYGFNSCGLAEAQQRLKARGGAQQQQSKG